MNLNPNYRYIGLDFETTGLDFNKDEPIQIGIVEIDNTGKIISEFSSLLKPNKDINELKTIVGFITGINIEDIINSPTPQDILPEIKQFFGENTILIGHNIKFDLEFLNKFFPGLSYADSIDTFPLAQAMIHYQSSYALEVLVPGLNAHNALQDTRNALILFQKIIDKIELIQTKYPILSHFIGNQSFSLSKYLKIDVIASSPMANMAIHGIIKDIPRLNKIMGSYTQPQPDSNTISLSELEVQKRYYLGNTDLKSFLGKIIPNKNIVLAFSNIQKLNIAKSMLNNMGIKNLGFLKDDQMIDYEKFENFLNKKSFTNEEILFVCKYYSHLEQGLGLLDLNNKSDYQIYHFIKNKKEKIRYPIVLATHQGLFSYTQENSNEYQDYEILFFDAERRYKSYNLFLSRPLDMYYTLNFIETLLYKQSLESQIGTSGKQLRYHSDLKDLESESNRTVISNEREKSTLINKPTFNHLSQFYTSFQIFIGQLFIESKQLFTGNSLDRIQSNPVTTQPVFYKTNLLWKQIKESIKNIESEVDEKDFDIINKQFIHIDNLFNTVINIEKKMTNEDMYFVYSEHTQYTSRPEFIEIFKSPIYFFSSSDKTATNLFPNETKKINIKTNKIGLYDRILSYLQNSISIQNGTTIANVSQEQGSKSFFIASTRKEESKQLFETLYKNNIHNSYTIVAENITGGAGKNIFKLKNEKPKIIIGGYAFLLAVYAECIPLDEIIIFNIRGNNEQSILDDIQWYANK